MNSTPAVVQHGTSSAYLTAINTEQSDSSALAGSHSVGDFYKKRPQCQGQNYMGLLQCYTLEEALNAVKASENRLYLDLSSSYVTIFNGNAIKSVHSQRDQNTVKDKIRNCS